MNIYIYRLVPNNYFLHLKNSLTQITGSAELSSRRCVILLSTKCLFPTLWLTLGIVFQLECFQLAKKQNYIILFYILFPVPLNTFLVCFLDLLFVLEISCLCLLLIFSIEIFILLLLTSKSFHMIWLLEGHVH